MLGTYGTVDVTTQGIANVYISKVSQVMQGQGGAGTLGRSATLNGLRPQHHPASVIVWVEGNRGSSRPSIVCICSQLALFPDHPPTCPFALAVQSVAVQLGGITSLYLETTGPEVTITGR